MSLLTGDINFVHLVQELPSRFFTVKLLLFPIVKDIYLMTVRMILYGCVNIPMIHFPYQLQHSLVILS